MQPHQRKVLRWPLKHDEAEQIMNIAPAEGPPPPVAPESAASGTHGKAAG